MHCYSLIFSGQPLYVYEARWFLRFSVTKPFCGSVPVTFTHVGAVKGYFVRSANTFRLWISTLPRIVLRRLVKQWSLPSLLVCVCFSCPNYLKVFCLFSVVVGKTSIHVHLWPVQQFSNIIVQVISPFSLLLAVRLLDKIAFLFSHELDTVGQGWPSATHSMST
jgi:hypothetical protein